MSDEAWTAEEAAGFLKIAPKTVRSMAKAGRMPATKVGRLWRFDQKTVRDWFSNKTEENVRPCPSTNAKSLRIGRSDSRSLASKLSARREQLARQPRRNWKESSVMISGGRSSSGNGGSPGTMP